MRTAPPCRTCPNSQPQSPTEWWRKQGPVTQMLLAAVIGASLLPVALRAVDTSLAFVASSTVRTAVGFVVELVAGPLYFVLGLEIGLGLLFTLWMISLFSTKAETEVFGDYLDETFPFPGEKLFTLQGMPQGRKSTLVRSLRYLYFLTLTVAVLTAASVVLRVFGSNATPASALPSTLSLVWCRMQPIGLKLNVMGLKVSARIYPLVMLAVHFLMGSSVILDLVGMAFGQLFVHTVREDRDKLDTGRKLFEVPDGVYAFVKRQMAKILDRKRRQGSIFPN